VSVSAAAAATGLVSVAVFMAAFFLVGILPAAQGAIATARGALAAMRNPGLDDLAREKAVQKASLGLFAGFGSILLRSLAALALAYLPILAADALGLAPEAEVADFLSRLDVIAALSVVITLLWVLAGRLWPSR
jgi:hypothetical protein